MYEPEWKQQWSQDQAEHYLALFMSNPARVILMDGIKAMLDDKRATLENIAPEGLRFRQGEINGLKLALEKLAQPKP